MFFATLALLAWQMSAGRDPALGASVASTQTAAKPRKVVVRKIVITRVIQRPDAVRSAAAVPQRAPAPATTRVVPAQPAPAPAPAPVVTRSS